MKIQRSIWLLTACWSSLLAAQEPVPMFTSREDALVQSAANVLQEMMAAPASRIPQSMLADAQGLVIVPGVVKGGFIVGVRHGNGVALIRDAQGHWQAPLFLSLTGGSIGWQAGLQSTDLILVFKTPRSVQNLMSGKFTIGVDAAAAAGPVGRQAAAATDARLQAEIFSYSRSRGLFAGLSLDGSVLQMQPAMTQSFYQAAGGSPGTSAVPASAVRLVELVTRYTNTPDEFAAQPLPGQAAPGFTPTGPATPTTVNLSEAVVRQQLIDSSKSLQLLLDDNWRKFLALPSDLYAEGKFPAPQELQAALARYTTVAQDPQFAALTRRQEFQLVYDRLRTYANLRNADVGGLSLPPPPATGGATFQPQR